MVYCNTMPLKEIIPKNALDTSTPADALSDRAAELEKTDPLRGFFGAGKSAMDIAEMFGIDRKTIGTMLLKSILSGKLELPGMKNEVTKRKKLEVMVDQIIKLILTCFGIFMGYKIFELVVTLLVVA